MITLWWFCLFKLLNVTFFAFVFYQLIRKKKQLFRNTWFVKVYKIDLHTWKCTNHNKIALQTSFTTTISAVVFENTGRIHIIKLTCWTIFTWKHCSIEFFKRLVNNVPIFFDTSRIALPVTIILKSIRITRVTVTVCSVLRRLGMPCSYFMFSVKSYLFVIVVRNTHAMFVEWHCQRNNVHKKIYIYMQIIALQFNHVKNTVYFKKI